MAAASGSLWAALRSKAHMQQKELVIVSWGGRLDEPFRHAADRLEAAHPGVKVTLVPGQGAEVIAKIKAYQGTSPYDTFGNDEPALLESMSECLIEKIDPAGGGMHWGRIRAAPLSGRSPPPPGS